MSISGIVVHVHADTADTVKARLAAMPGVEVHAATEQGRLVVTVDQPDDAKAADTFVEMQNMEGVLSAALVFNYCEQYPAEKEHAQ